VWRTRSLALARCCYDLCRCSDYLHMAYGAMAHMAARVCYLYYYLYLRGSFVVQRAAISLYILHL